MCMIQGVAPLVPPGRVPWFPQPPLASPQGHIPETTNPKRKCGIAKCAKVAYAKATFDKAKCAMAKFAKAKLSIVRFATANSAKA